MRNRIGQRIDVGTATHASDRYFGSILQESDQSLRLSPLGRALYVNQSWFPVRYMRRSLRFRSQQLSEIYPGTRSEPLWVRAVAGINGVSQNSRATRAERMRESNGQWKEKRYEYYSPAILPQYSNVSPIGLYLSLSIQWNNIIPWLHLPASLFSLKLNQIPVWGNLLPYRKLSFPVVIQI